MRRRRRLDGAPMICVKASRREVVGWGDIKEGVHHIIIMFTIGSVHHIVGMGTTDEYNQPIAVKPVWCTNAVRP